MPILTLMRLGPLLLIACLAGNVAAQDERLAVRVDKNRKDSDSLRQDILDQLRCAGDDPAVCFHDPALDSGFAPMDDDAGVDALIAEILAGLRAHEEERLRQAAEELQAEARDETDWFGSADHHMHPSTDLYEDPLKAYTSRPDLLLAQIDPRDFDYPLVVNEPVQSWMVYFLTRGRTWFTRWLARAERYEPLIKPMLKEAGLPQDLFYQAMIESGFNPYATSHASAVGVWQFISSTGREFGLEQDWWIDERRDPVLATQSAIAFMGRLYARFGDWQLASAAYNAGPGKIGRAIDMYGTEDFWELASSQRSYLRAETKNYVPKIMAAAILSKYAARYGLTDEIPAEHRLGRWTFDVVPVPEATDLRVVADFAGVTVEEMEAINPALRRGYTPPGTTNYPLNVPIGSGALVAQKIAEIPEDQRITFVRHKVSRGDSLSSIAGKYGVPVATVQQMNQLKSSKSLRSGSTLLIPVRASDVGARTVTHVVARGESLSAIAARYQTSVDTLKERNGLSSDVLQVGQRLTVDSFGAEPVARAESSSRSTSSASGAPSSSRSSATLASFHTVQRGDSLYAIASQYGTSVDDLRALNQFGRDAVIHPGDKVRVRADVPEAPRSRSYKVQSGDTLSTIASRHGMSTSELMKLNKLSSDRIVVGQSLQVTGAAPAERTSTAASGTSKPSSYTVRSGDTLSAIAKSHGLSVSELKSLNRLSSDTIRPGQTLKVRN